MNMQKIQNKQQRLNENKNRLPIDKLLIYNRFNQR